MKLKDRAELFSFFGETPACNLRHKNKGTNRSEEDSWCLYEFRLSVEKYIKLNYVVNQKLKAF